VRDAFYIVVVIYLPFAKILKYTAIAYGFMCYHTFYTTLGHIAIISMDKGRSVKLSQSCEIASGLPCYAYRYDPRNDGVYSTAFVITSVAKQSQIHNNLTVLPPQWEKTSGLSLQAGLLSSVKLRLLRYARW
jgi:hypothetical protein